MPVGDIPTQVRSMQSNSSEIRRLYAENSNLRAEILSAIGINSRFADCITINYSKLIDRLESTQKSPALRKSPK